MTSVEESLARLQRLVSPVGVINHVRQARYPRGLHRTSGFSASIGSGRPGRGQDGDRPTTGGGLALDDPALAHLIALAESAERYCGGNGAKEPIVTCTAADLDGPSLDLAAIPRCSRAELAVAGCPLRSPDPRAAIRWMRGFDIESGLPLWLPAIMACYNVPGELPSEKFWYRISTGCAVHTDPAEALVRGICEVIERDAIAVVWLQRISLPIVPHERVSARCRYIMDWAERHFIDTFLFDATNDLGVPIVYCLQVAQHDRSAMHSIGCAASRSIDSAAEKAMIEALGMRRQYRSGIKPEKPDESPDSSNATRSLTAEERAKSFEFLIEGAGGRPAPPRSTLPEDPVQALSTLKTALASSGMQAIAVDLTTRELELAGLTAISTVIPALQPMTKHPLAQYRAHRRLYDAPALMGYTSRSEEELNPWPQPFG